MDVAPVELDFLRRLLIDIGEAVVDKVDGTIVEGPEVVAGEVEILAPLEA